MLATAEQTAWVQEHLGVVLTAVPAGPGGPAMRSAPGGPSPGGGLPGPESKATDITDQMVEDVIGDPQKRIEALAKWKVPRFSDAYKDDSAESQFLDNLKSGTEKAQQYFNYINQAVDYAQKYGNFAGLDRVASAAKGIKDITDRLSGGLAKAGKAINKIKEGIEWIKSMDQFADATLAMD